MRDFGGMRSIGRRRDSYMRADSDRTNIEGYVMMGMNSLTMIGNAKRNEGILIDKDSPINEGIMIKGGIVRIDRRYLPHDYRSAPEE